MKMNKRGKNIRNTKFPPGDLARWGEDLLPNIPGNEGLQEEAGRCLAEWYLQEICRELQRILPDFFPLSQSNTFLRREIICNPYCFRSPDAEKFFMVTHDDSSLPNPLLFRFSFRFFMSRTA